MKHIADTLDSTLFTVVPHVAVIDTFRMCAADGSFVADITSDFIDRLIAHMREREALTGDLCPIVIGHTQDGIPETEQPPLVGYARNWHKDLLGETGRECAFADFWILKDQVDLVRKFPRRSAECWAHRYEIDPISLLGATTPARDLGLLRLSREGSFTYTAPGDLKMAEDKKPEPKAEPKKEDKPEPKAKPEETGAAKGTDGKLDQILAMLGQLFDSLGGGAGAGAGATPAPGGDAQMGDAEYEKMLQEILGQQGGEGAPSAPSAPDASRAGEKPTPNAGGYVSPGGSNTKVPLQRTPEQTRMDDLQAQVDRMTVKDKLVKLARTNSAIDPEDSALVEDLAAMEPTIRERTIERLAKMPAPAGAGSTLLQRAIDQATSNSGLPNGGHPNAPKRITDRETMIRLQRKASDAKRSFESVAAEEGYDLSR